MLNPSTADARDDDPTIRRCISFGEELGYGGIAVVNLFARRTPSPAELKTTSNRVGKNNDKYISSAFKYAHITQSLVVAAWGGHGRLDGRDAEVLKLAENYSVPLHALHINDDDTPKHPLYVAGNTLPLLYARSVCMDE
jgi:hypothetical protein